MTPVDSGILYGQTHDAVTLEVEGDVDGLSIQAIELGDGITGGGEEVEREHQHLH